MTAVNRRIIIYIIVGLVLVLIIGAMVAMNSGNSEGGLLAPAGDSIAELLSLGQRYLLELNYEAAIVAFTRVIEIDPRNVEALVGRGTAHVLWQEDLALARADYELALSIDDRSVGAYLGLVDIYVRLGDFERALELARLGYEMTGDAALREMVEALEGGTVRDSEGRVRRMRHYFRDDGFVFFSVRSYAQGRLVGFTTYDPSGNLIAHGDVIYDEHGNRLQGFSYGSNNGIIMRTEHTVDSAGRRIRSDFFNEDGYLNAYNLYEYGDNDIRTRRTRFDSNGIMRWYAIYNAQGHTIRRNSLDSNGRLRSYTLYELDDEGNSIRSSSFSADGTLTAYTVHERDAAGNRISTTTYNADGTVISREVMDGAQPGNED